MFHGLKIFYEEKLMKDQISEGKILPGRDSQPIGKHDNDVLFVKDVLCPNRHTIHTW